MNEDNELYGQDDDRERVNSDKAEDQAQGLAANVDPRNANAETRPPRVAMKRGANVTFADVDFDREKFHYYAFLDDPNKPGRIESARAAYWEDVPNRTGTPATRPDKSGGTHRLMRLPIEYWREDLNTKKQKIRARMATENKLGKNEYAPDAKTGAAGGGKEMYRSTSTSDNPFAE